MRGGAAGVALPVVGRDASGAILKFSDLFGVSATAEPGAVPSAQPGSKRRRRTVRFAPPGARQCGQ